MIPTHRSRVRAWLALAVLCGGGLLPGTCMIRTKEALVNGTKSFVASTLLNPSNIADLPFENLTAE